MARIQVGDVVSLHSDITLVGTVTKAEPFTQAVEVRWDGGAPTRFPMDSQVVPVEKLCSDACENDPHGWD